jgi:hypothetical protein
MAGHTYQNSDDSGAIISEEVTIDSTKTTEEKDGIVTEEEKSSEKVTFIEETQSSDYASFANPQYAKAQMQGYVQALMKAKIDVANIKWGMYQPFIFTSGAWPTQFLTQWGQSVMNARTSLAGLMLSPGMIVFPNAPVSPLPAQLLKYNGPYDNKLSLLDAIVAACFNAPCQSATDQNGNLTPNGIPISVTVTTKTDTSPDKFNNDIDWKWTWTGTDQFPTILNLVMICPFNS